MDAEGKLIVPEGSLLISIRESGVHSRSRGKQHHITVGFGVRFCKGTELSLPQFLPPPIGEKFKKKIRHIIDEFTVTRTTTVNLAGDILLLLSDISAEYQKMKETGSNYGNFFYVEKAKQYIASHIDQKLYVADIAAGVGLSIGYLSNIFHHVTGQTLVEFINRTKLARVKELTERGLTIKEAGRLTGYEDENYVSRIYKKYFGKNLTGRTKSKN